MIARKGVTLVELLITSSIILAMCGAFYFTGSDLITQLPRQDRITQQAQTVAACFDALRVDCDAAEQLLANDSDETNTIRLRAGEDVIVWQAGDGFAERRRGKDITRWTFDRGRVDLRIHRIADHPAAVEASTAMRLDVDGGTLRRLERCELMFVGSLPGRRVRR
jgi:hypothetical protein